MVKYSQHLRRYVEQLDVHFRVGSTQPVQNSISVISVSLAIYKESLDGQSFQVGYLIFHQTDKRRYDDSDTRLTLNSEYDNVDPPDMLTFSATAGT